MNTDSNTISEFPIDPRGNAPATMSETRPMYWSVRRELWENRFIYLAPLVVAAVVLFGSLITMISVSTRTRNADTAKQQARVVKPLNIAPAPIMLTTFIIGFFYCLDALYGERRDRSILFWKSLPVSDVTIVLSKASVPLVVLPLIAYALSVATQIVLLTLTTPVLAANGLNAWTEFAFFKGLIIMLYGLTVHALWFAPIYGWLLFISAWARRAPFLWAVLPLLAVSAFERIAFNSSLFMAMLGYRVMGAMREAFRFRSGGHGDIDRLSQLDPGRFLSAPGLWVGLAFAGGCIAAAVRLRRNREPI